MTQRFPPPLFPKPRFPVLSDPEAAPLAKPWTIRPRLIWVDILAWATLGLLLLR